MKVLNAHAPKKQRVMRGNHQPFMNKTLSKAFMHRSKLKNLFNKNPTEMNKTNYKGQRNFCVNLLKREKRNYYNNLDIKVLDDNKKFWQSIKPLLSNKQKSLQKDITIVDKDNIISKNSKVAEKLNNIFIDAVKNLDIESFAPNLETDSNINYINNILKRYENHPSILKIKVHAKVENKFKFKDATPNAFETEINRLDTKKAGMENDIPIKVLIDTNDIVSLFLSTIYNNSKNATKYPINLKLADVTPIHKKDETTLMKNYRPGSLIPIMSKLFERDMYDQILLYIDKYLSPYLFGYRKGYSTEQCLTVMLEVWKKLLMERARRGQY